MWVYHQSTGKLYHDGRYMGNGYSGKIPWKNYPNAQNRHGEGPIPRGRYTIGEPFDNRSRNGHHGTGPYSMRLAPYASNQMFGRSAFLIHGDSVNPKEFGNASDGCIILSKPLRHLVGTSGDRALEVVR